MSPVFRFSLRRWRAFTRCERGIAYIEFAYSLPVLLLLFAGSVELTRFVLILQNVEKTVTMVTDVTTQDNPTSYTNAQWNTQMSSIMSAVTDMMNPYTTGTSDPNIYVIISDIQASATAANAPTLNWKYCGGGTYTPSGGSRITLVANSIVRIPGLADITLVNSPQEEVVVGEVFYNFAPLMGSGISVIPSTLLYRTAIYMPRLGALTSFSPSPATCS